MQWQVNLFDFLIHKLGLLDGTGPDVDHWNTPVWISRGKHRSSCCPEMSISTVEHRRITLT